MGEGGVLLQTPIDINAVPDDTSPLLAGNDSKRRLEDTVSGPVFNLMNSIVGGGISIIALPLGVQDVGIITFVIFVLLSALATALSCKLLADAAVLSGQSSYSDLGRAAYGGIGFTIVTIFIFLNNLGVCITFLQTFADVIPEYLHTICERNDAPLILSNRSLLVGLVGICLLPLMMILKHIETLKYSSFLALGLVIVFFIYMVVELEEVQKINNATDPTDLSRFPHSMKSILNCISLLSLSYTCHFNIIPIQNGLKRPQNISKITYISVTLASLLFIFVAFIGYIAAPTEQTGDILAEFYNVPFHQFRICVVVAMILTYPLIAFEGQHTLKFLVFGNNTKLISIRLQELLTAFVFTGTATIVAVSISKTGDMIALVGSLCGIPIMYILPCMLYLRVCFRHDTEDVSGFSDMHVTAKVILAGGVLVFVLCVTNSVMAFTD
eukprot:m.342951 g.342951  ORF g.342951 m.342951 type:complete len:440 (+) comp22135_c0_seq1:316-1635(+)